MHYPDHPTADVITDPLKPRYTEGDPANNIAPTVVTAEHLNDIFFNMMAVLDAAGVLPVKGREQDLLDAIQTLVSGGGGSGNVAVTGADTNPGALAGKFTAGMGLTETVLNTGGNEALQVAIDKSTSAQHIAGTATDVFPDVAGVKEMIDVHGGADNIWGTQLNHTVNDLPIMTVSASDDYSLPYNSPNGLPFGLEREIFDPTITNTTATFVAGRFTVRRYTGSIRFRATHSAQNLGSGANISFLSLYKNNVLLSNWSTYSAATQTQDISIIPGDVIEWRHRGTAGGTTNNSLPNSSVGSMSAFATDGYTRIGAPIRLSEL